MPSPSKSGDVNRPPRDPSTPQGNPGYEPVEQSADDAELDEGSSQTEPGTFENEGGNVPVQVSGEDLGADDQAGDEGTRELLAGEDETGEYEQTDEEEGGPMGNRVMGQPRRTNRGDDTLRL